MPDSISIRPASPDDVPLVLEFIRELAIYERLEHEMQATTADLAAALFGAHPCAEVVFACLDGVPVGYALFIRPQVRGRGTGRRLLAWLARTTLERGCARLDWAVLDWNAPSIAFYQGIGAVAQDDWITMRVSGADLARLAAS